ncbi:MAG: hypothetical protein ACP5NL_05195 [Thermoplasmata archaeon]
MYDFYYSRGNRLNRHLNNAFTKKSTLFLNREWEGSGFLLKSRYTEKIGYLLEPFLFKIYGTYKVRMLVPSFDQSSVSILVLIPDSIARTLKNNYIRCKGIIDELSNYITISGRFVLINELDPIDMNTVFKEVQPAIDEHRLLNMIDESVDKNGSLLNRFLKLFYISTPLYYSKSGGIGAYFINYEPGSSHFTDLTTVRNIKDSVKEIETVIHPLFRSGIISYTNQYDEREKISKKFSMPIKYQHSAEDEVSRLLGSRTNSLELTFTTIKSGKANELSALQKDIITYIDQPLLVSKEDLQFELGELKEYSLDIGHMALLKHFSNVQSELSAKEIFEIRARMLHNIEKNIPEIKECMENNVFFNDSVYGGLGEQAIRMVNSLKRYGLDNMVIEQSVSAHLTDILERIYEQYSPQIKKELAKLKIVSNTQRKQKIAMRAVSELSWFLPDCWQYDDFEKLLFEKDMDSWEIEKLFSALKESRFIYETKKGCYKAIQ